MHEQAGLEYLSVDASEADDHHALLLLKASDSAILRGRDEACRRKLLHDNAARCYGLRSRPSQ